MARKTNIFLAIGLILVAVLAGCSNNVSYPHYPVSATIEQTGDFLEGQSFVSSNFKVTVTYLDGSQKEYPNAGVVLDDPDGIVNAGDTVSINVGSDVNGKDVIGKRTLDVYKLSSITATAAKESYVEGEEVKAEDITVTAHYEGEKTLVLMPTDYSVSPVQVPVPDPAATTVDGYIIVLVNSALAESTSVGATYKIPVTVVQTTAIESISISNIGSVKLGKLNYTDYDDFVAVNELDPSKVKVTINYEGGYEDVLASEVEDLKLEYWNIAKNVPINDPIFTTDFDLSSSNTEIGLKATLGEQSATTNVAISLDDKTQVKAEYVGEGVVDGAVLADAVSAEDFEIYLMVNGVTSEVVAEDEDLAITYYDAETDGSTITTMVTYNEGKGYAYASVTYKGVTDASRVAIKSLEKAPETYTITPVFKDGQPALYKQNHINAPQLVPATLFERVTVTGSYNEAPVLDRNKDNWDNSLILAYYSAEDVDSVVPSDTKDFSGFDELYLGITYVAGKTTQFFAVDLLESPNTVTSITASATPAAGMVGDEVKVVVTAQTAEGGIIDVTDDVIVELDGIPAEFPTVFGETESGEYTIYLSDDYTKSDTVKIPAGTGYYAPAEGYSALALKLKDDAPAKVAEGEIAKTVFNSMYEIDTKSYATIGIPTGSAPSMVADITDTRKLSAGANTIDVTITYTGSTGELVTEKTSVTITTTPYVASIADEAVLLYGNDEFKAFEQGKVYDLSQFRISESSYTVKGGELILSTPEVTSTDERDYTETTVTGNMQSNYTLTFKYDLTDDFTPSQRVFNFTAGVLVSQK